MKGVSRKYVKKWVVKDVGDQPILIHDFSDMSNQDLAESLSIFLEKEDFEYCEELVAEAQLRGITLNQKKTV